MSVLFIIGLLLMMPLIILIVGSLLNILCSNITREEFICIIFVLLFLVGLVMVWWNIN